MSMGILLLYYRGIFKASARHLFHSVVCVLHPFLNVSLQEIQDDLAQVQAQMNQLAAERFLAQSGPVDAATAEALESGAAVPWPQQAETAAIIAADAAVANEAALSGLQNVVQTWQAELINFRQVR
jgi:phage tail sheath gpL-like